MYTVYILYSEQSKRTYTGYTNDVKRRLQEHNVTETRGFTLRYRPWTIIHSEEYQTINEAREREKFLKTGKGRQEVKGIVAIFLKGNSAVSALAEKD
jgi:putative endonuclease